MRQPILWGRLLPLFLALCPLGSWGVAVGEEPDRISTIRYALSTNVSVVSGQTFSAESATQTSPEAVVIVVLSSDDNNPSPTNEALPTAGAAATAAAAAMAAQQAVSSPIIDAVQDPANQSFMGQIPDATVDLPLTIVFLLLFGAAAFTHISIYRANAKRGHKFLLSDVIFDFCMIRTLTCIFRIIWVFVGTRGVVLAALIFENGG